MPSVNAVAPSPRSPDNQYFAAIALLTVLTAFVFGPVLTHEFIALDYDTYTGNPVIQRGLSWDGVQYAFTEVVASNWHPVTVIAHMSLHTLFGSDPPAHYAANLVLHWINVLLVFEIFRRSTGAIWRSALVAALFGLHPFRIESVAWTAELKDVLSGSFALLAILAYVRYAGARSWRFYTLSVALFVLGLLAKASIITLPVLLLIFDRWPLIRAQAPGDRQRMVIEKVPYLVVAVAMAVVTLATFQDSTLRSSDVLTLPTRAAMACIAYKDYLLTTFWPARLSPHYPYTSANAPPLETAVSVALLLVVGAFAFSQRRSHPYLLFGWSWFVVAILPVCGVLPVGSHYRADRYTYLAHIGLFAAVVWYAAAVAWRRRLVLRASQVLAAAAVLALASASYVHVHRWRDNITLFEYSVTVTPQSALVRTGLAIGLIQRQRYNEAEQQLRDALRISPRDVPNMERLAALLVVTDRAAESVPLQEEIVRAKPYDATSHAALAVARARSGDRDGAESAARAALTLDPSNAAALAIVGRSASDR